MVEMVESKSNSEKSSELKLGDSPLKKCSLAPRQPFVHEGEPAVAFTDVEIAQSEALFQYTLIAKFSAGRHSVYAIILRNTYQRIGV